MYQIQFLLKCLSWVSFFKIKNSFIAILELSLTILTVHVVLDKKDTRRMIIGDFNCLILSEFDGGVTKCQKFTENYYLDLSSCRSVLFAKRLNVKISTFTHFGTTRTFLFFLIFVTALLFLCLQILFAARGPGAFLERKIKKSFNSDNYQQPKYS